MHTTTNDFLGGALKIEQPTHGYRAGVDPVFMAAAVPARGGQSVLELGCGVGTALLCLGHRVEGLSLTGVEIDADTADLARANASANDLPARIETADLTSLPPGLASETFDHVMFNPPYFSANAGTAAQDFARDTARHEKTPLSSWFKVAAQRLKPKGILTVIQRADRLPDMLKALPGQMGSVTVQPFAPRHGKPSNLIILSATHGGRAEFSLQNPVILHDGATHAADQGRYSEDVENVLRKGFSWPWLCN